MNKTHTKRPVAVSAHRWNQNGDHPEDKYERGSGKEGEVVKRYRKPHCSGLNDGLKECDKCGHIMRVHGWIDTHEGGHIVCPGDWIITGVEGERYPCKPNIFYKTYDELTCGSG